MWLNTAALCTCLLHVLYCATSRVFSPYLGSASIDHDIAMKGWHLGRPVTTFTDK